MPATRKQKLEAEAKAIQKEDEEDANSHRTSSYNLRSRTNLVQDHSPTPGQPCVRMEIAIREELELKRPDVLTTNTEDGDGSPHQPIAASLARDGVSHERKAPANLAIIPETGLSRRSPPTYTPLTERQREKKQWRLKRLTRQLSRYAEGNNDGKAKHADQIKTDTQLHQNLTRELKVDTENCETEVKNRLASHDLDFGPPPRMSVRRCKRIPETHSRLAMKTDRLDREKAQRKLQRDINRVHITVEGRNQQQKDDQQHLARSLLE